MDTTIKLQDILEKHKKWLENADDGECANLSRANLSRADLSDADLSGADLSSADLSGADLSQSNGLLDPAAWMAANFGHDDRGWIVYKAFGDTYYSKPDAWEVEPGAIIEEVVNRVATDDCGCGVNYAIPQWINKNFSGKDVVIWKCRIAWIDACGIVVPYNTDGKARCGRLELIEKLQ